MVRKSDLTVLAILLTIFVVPVASLAGENDTKPAIDLSPELMSLLRAEMAQLSGGVQSIALYIATADWKAIEATSEKMHGSYIMKKSLTKSQAMELKHKLPFKFKQLDAAFHTKAKQLGLAAAAKDSELVSFRYSRVVEACAQCHSEFAKGRFPGFARDADEHHEH